MTRGIIITITILFLLSFSAIMLTLLIKGLYSRNQNTDKKLIDELLQIFSLNDTDRFADLGAGDFRLVFAVAESSEAYATGFEMAPITFFIARIRKFIKFRFNRNVKVSHKNFFNVDLKEFNVIYINLQEEIMTQLMSKLSNELSANCKIYSYRNKFYGTPILNEHKLSNGEKVFEYSRSSFKAF